ncbi:MAG: hypothetical protein M1820_003212 [Bogoriella megaspora]|nr:MAG: hypothetical protein M1820_003212 [Bogoriella megaspora]
MHCDLSVAIRVGIYTLFVTQVLADDGPSYNDPKYVPAPSIGHELGIMFGFIAAMLLSMFLYTIIWQMGNKRSVRKEAERVEALRKAGYMDVKRNDRNGEVRAGMGDHIEVKRPAERDFGMQTM